MEAVTLGEFLERSLPLELAMGEMFRRLAVRLDAIPPLAAAVRQLEQDERSHHELIRCFRDSLPPSVLARPCHDETIRLLGRVEALLEGDPLERFSDFQQAFEFIHELENSEVAPMIRLLHRECPTEGIDCSALTAIVEPHLAHVESLAEAAGERARRRAIRI